MTNERLPAYHRWAICPECEGNGHHARHLGSYTAEEFREAFSDEEADDYFAGLYDKVCANCGGTGKVAELAQGAPFAVRRAYVEERRARRVNAEIAAEVRAELRHCGYEC